MSDHRLQTVHRFRVPDVDVSGFRDGIAALTEQWHSTPGWLSGELWRNLDEPDLWVLTAIWADVGSYRRHGLGGMAKMLWMPVMGWVVDEPSAYLSPEALD